jgi:hypothetical protein
MGLGWANLFSLLKGIETIDFGSDYVTLVILARENNCNPFSLPVKISHSAHLQHSNGYILLEHVWPSCFPWSNVIKLFTIVI